MSMVYQVKNWDKFFEGAKSKTYNNKTSCSMPTKHGLGYKKLIRSENGPALFGAWCSLIQILSKHEKPRKGYCTDTGGIHGTPYLPADLEILTDIPSELFEKLFPLLETIGWVDVREAKDTTGIPQYPAVSPQYPLNSNLDSNLNSDSNSCGDDFDPAEEALQKLSEPRRDALRLWQRHCTENRRDMKPTALALLLDKWKDVSDARFIAAVKYSIGNNYNGIYEEGTKQGKQKKVEVGIR